MAYLMVKDIDEHYVPAECYTFDEEGNLDCENCIIIKIMDEYTKLTGQC